MTPDVAIVGGGIVGTATAAFLAEAGLSVTLYESTDIAAGASGRNSGVVQQPFDPALVGLYRRSLELYRDLAAAMPDAFRLDAEPSGLLYIGPEAAAAEAERLVAVWTETYPETEPELLTGQALRSLEPSLADGLAACRLRIGYPVAPASATFAFAALAVAQGVRIARGGCLLRVERDRATGILVGGRPEPAGAVVVAAGPWTQPVMGHALWPPIGRSWGAVAGLALERPPGHVLEEIDIDIEPVDEAAGNAGAAPRRVEAGLGFSLVTAAGQSALGSTFLPERPDQMAVLPLLRARGARYLPELARAALSGMRTCARPVTPDGRPLIGPVPGIEGAFVAAGHGPWGISTGPGSARLLADLILGRAAALDVPSALDAARFGVPQRLPLPG